MFDAHTMPGPLSPYLRAFSTSPHVFLLGILFRHKAFLPGFISPEDFEKLDIHTRENELPVPL